ncbi:phage head morphogenesis protein, partial [Pediococcus acidilactici]
MKSNDYWTKRTQEIMAQLDKDDPELTNAVLAEYKQAAEEIDKKIYNFYDKYAKDNKLSYQEAMKRVRAVDMRDYVKRANAYRRANKKNPELLKRLNAQYMSSKITRLELLKLEIEFSVLQASNE